MKGRLLAFVVVGAVGFTLQLGVLAVLIAWQVALPLATAIAVEAAVIHNYVWHERWTWRDRAANGGRARRLLRFHSSNALTSIAINVVVTWLLVRQLDMPPVAANALSVAAASALNYLAADRWVFGRRAERTGTSLPGCTAGLDPVGETIRVSAERSIAGAAASW